MIRYILLLILSFSFPLLLQAQQVPQYTLYSFNPLSYNPAYSGLATSLEANGVFRKQWTGLKGSPTTQNFNVHAPIYYLKSGIGLNIENDMIGVMRNTKIALTYAYHIKIGKKNTLSIGASGAFAQLALDGSKLLAPEGDYDENLILHNDLFLPNSKVNGITYDIDAGIYFKSSNLDLGFSALHLTESNIDYLVNDGVEFSYRRHFLGFAAYKIDFNNSITLRPSVLVKSDFSQVQTDISAVVEYNEQFLLGVGFRGFNEVTIDALSITGGAKISKHWQVLYAYDISLSGLKQVNQGSHEVMLKYTLDKKIGKGKLPKVIHNPRLL